MDNALRLSLALLVLLLTRPALAQFPDAHDPPPAGWTGQVFKLKQDYPQTLPPTGSRPWTAISFKTKPNDYMKAVLAYALEGNKEVDFVVEHRGRLAAIEIKLISATTAHTGLYEFCRRNPAARHWLVGSEELPLGEFLQQPASFWTR